ncbi:MAG: acyl-CoA thioesterase [Sphingomonas sp.]
MARPADWRLDPAAYPHHDTIQTRFADLDVLGHINNVAWAALFETARVRFFHMINGSAPGRGRGLVANVEINYLGEGSFPADIVMAHGIGRLGTRSWQTLGLALQHGQPLATCDVTIVTAGGASEIDPDFRTALEGWAVREGVG